MPRTHRASVGGLCYHVINRGVAGLEVFHEQADYRAFLDMMAEGNERLPMRLLALCVMPNHFHLVLRPHGDGDLSRWMHRLMTSQVARYRGEHEQGGLGHLWQGRFKAFPVQGGRHLLRVMRYVEANPLRAGLVPRAEQWPWSSLALRRGDPPAGLLSPWPVRRPSDWLARVNRPQRQGELEGLRRSVNRQSPYGGEVWVRRTAAELGLESTLRPRGRPRKTSGPRPKK
jgi:putative transposase